MLVLFVQCLRIDVRNSEHSSRSADRMTFLMHEFDQAQSLLVVDEVIDTFCTLVGAAFGVKL